MVSDLRSLGQELTAFGAQEEDRAYILSHIVAFHHLHRGQLREMPWPRTWRAGPPMPPADPTPPCVASLPVWATWPGPVRSTGSLKRR